MEAGERIIITVTVLIALIGLLMLVGGGATGNAIYAKFVTNCMNRCDGKFSINSQEWLDCAQQCLPKKSQ